MDSPIAACQAEGLLAQCFDKLPWKEHKESWPEANLRETMFYLRRSKRVDLPMEYKALIPKNDNEDLL